MRGDAVTNGSARSMSLVIPTFNRVGLLRNALDSVAVAAIADPAQVEVIVVDNNSTDGTAAAVQEARDRFPCSLRYFLERNQGSSYARNRGLAESQGFYVVFMDDDQVMGRDYFKNIPLAFAETGAVCVGGSVTYYNAENLPPWLRELSRTIGQTSCGDQVRILGPDTPKGLFGGNMAFVRSDLVAAGGFDIRLGRFGNDQGTCEDLELQERLRGMGKLIGYHPGLVQHHYLRPQRFRKSYWRRYYYDHGGSAYTRAHLVNRASQRTVCRVPVWLWRFLFAEDLPAYFTSLFSFDSIKIFRRELNIWARIGQIHQARRMSKV